MSFLLNLPPGLSFFIVCAVTVAIAVTGLLIVRRKYTHEVFKENHEVAAIIFNAFGLLYAVMVAFVVFVVWERYDDAGKNFELEASQAADLYYVAKAFPDSVWRPIHVAMYEYTTTILEDELPAMSNGQQSTKTVDAIKKLMTIFTKMESKNLQNQGIFDDSFKRLNDLNHYRRLRLFESRDSVPSVIWVVLLAGAIITVAYTYFFANRKIFPQSIMTAALTITITLILFLIFILDHPFKGTTAIKGDAMEEVSQAMKESLIRENLLPK